MKCTFALLVLLAAAQTIQAYPLFWVSDVLPNDVLKGAALTSKNCVKHPTTKEKGHGAPTADKAITFSVTAAGETAPVKAVCPGVEYTVTVGYPEKRRTLLTSTVGAFEGANATCPGATYTLKSEKSEMSYNKTLTVPCNTTEAATTLEVTSASGPKNPFGQATMKMPIAGLADCPTSTCAAAAANATDADAAAAPGGKNATTKGGANATAGANAGDAKPADAAKAKSAAGSTGPVGALVAGACLLVAAAFAL